jgi:peptide/nickel transport system ATP-binding protein
MTAGAQLKVENLVTDFVSKKGAVRALDGVSFEVHSGQIMGLVGESGSGKSLTGFSIMGLLGESARVQSGRVLLGDQDLGQMTAEQMRSVRGRRISMIFQDPMMTLNPVMTIEAQMIEAIQAHRDVSTSQARVECVEMLTKVGISFAQDRLRAYPHQFSGGMRQRVAIAIALINQPDVIIADEPTTALDVTIQGQILSLIQSICRDMDTSVIWITHDLAVVSAIADHICVMYAGKIVEQGKTETVLGQPAHPYTRGLIRSIPSSNKPGQPLYQIPGITPALARLPTGCAFKARCDRSTHACEVKPTLMSAADEHHYLCHFPYAEPLEFP